jgi:hypothetical protein
LLPLTWFSLGFSSKTLDPQRSKPQTSNLTSET